MLTMRWVKPATVVEVAFVEWTADAFLRHAQFIGVCEDKSRPTCSARTYRVDPLICPIQRYGYEKTLARLTRSLLAGIVSG